jgi:hypothetical protein
MGALVGGVGSLGLMPGMLLGGAVLHDVFHFKIEQVLALEIPLEISINLIVWVAFIKLTHGFSAGFEKIEELVIPNSETWKKAKRWLYQARYYFLGLLVMYCGLRRFFRPNGWLFLVGQIGIFILLCVFLYSLGIGFKKFKEAGLKGFILPLYCIATIYVSFAFMPSLSVAIRDAEFKARIADYNSVVDAIKAGKVPSIKDGDFLKYPVNRAAFKNLPATVEDDICGFRLENCELRVYFGTCHLGGALGPHMGFVYIERLQEAPCKRTFPGDVSEYRTPMMGDWYSYYRN